MHLIKTYYLLRPLIPRRLQLFMRRQLIRIQRAVSAEIWPIMEQAAEPPPGWRGWPEGKQFALILTHDVDTAQGQARCDALSRLEDELGFRSSFNFVPERYDVSIHAMNSLRDRGFEIGVHGLYHDGKLYNTETIFKKRALRINQYIKEWGAVGFRSPAMHHDLSLLRQLNIEYDASTFDVDPFEPQPDGMGTIFPFIVPPADGRNGYLELPYTLPQDSTLFVMMREKNIDIWKHKLDWIVEHGGMALLNVHPDYMRFETGKLGPEEYPSSYYRDFLEYVSGTYGNICWKALPRDLARTKQLNFPFRS